MKQILLSLTISFLFAIGGYAQQIENAGFELWEDAGTVIDEPVDWSSIKTSDNQQLSNQAPVVWGLSEDAHSGQYSVKLINIAIFGIVATGTITNGRIHPNLNPDLANSYTDPTDAQWHTPFTWRPDSLVGWIKYYPKGTDRATMKAVLHVGEGTLPPGNTAGNHVGVAAYYSERGVTLDQWTRFSVPFVYNDDRTPEYMLLVVTAGDSTTATDSSYAFYDDLELIYNNASIDENLVSGNLIYTHGGMVCLDQLPADYYEDGEMIVYDLYGRERWKSNISSDRVQVPRTYVNEGIYLVSIKSGKNFYSQKVYIP